MSGRRNLMAGPVYENELLGELNEPRVFPHLYRSAAEDPEADKNKKDLVPKKGNTTPFPYSVQAKNTTSKVVYPKVLSDVKKLNPDDIPVIFHKYNANVKGRFLTKGKYGIMYQKDLLDLMVEKERYKQAYNELMTYWDSLPDEEKPKLNKFLENIGL